MSNLRRFKKLINLLAVVLCLAFIAALMVAFAGCDDVDVEADADESVYSDPEPYWASESGYVSGTYTFNDVYKRKTYTSFEVAESEIIETVQVENENVSEVGEFDENGVATCVYGGKSMYLTLGGGVYDFYPYYYTLSPISMTSETTEIQFSIVFDKKPERNGGKFSRTVSCLEVSSLTDESLDIADIWLGQGLHYGVEYEETDEGYKPYLIGLEDAVTFTSNLLDEGIYAGTMVANAIKIHYSLPGSFTATGDYYLVIKVKLGNGCTYVYGVSSLSNLSFACVPDEDGEEGIEGDIKSGDE